VGAELVAAAPRRRIIRPLITTAQFRLLFDPDGLSWAYRKLLVIGVLQELHTLGWQPKDAAEAATEVDEEPDELVAMDEHYVNGEELS
jgi:hypothetical protein